MSPFEFLRRPLITILLLLSCIQMNDTLGLNTIFVAPSGIDSDNCGSEVNPCGTIGFATALSIYDSNYGNIEKMDLYITGQNEEEISLWHSDNKNGNISFIDELKNNNHYFGDGWSVCVLYANYNKSISLTFDSSHIYSMTDWYPSICNKNIINAYLFWFYAESAGNSITFNNLIINDFTLEYGVQTLIFIVDSVSLILNNCLFSNINKVYFANIEHWHYLITATNITVVNSIFRDITISGQAYYESAFLRIASSTTNDITLNMYNCSITWYDNECGSFIFLNAQNFYSNVRSLSISNSIFSDINTASSLIVSTSYFGSWKVQIDIELTAFLNIDLGSILVTKNGHIVTIRDIRITTSQLVHDLIDSDESYLISLFAFSGGDQVQINNISLHYIYDLQTNCRKMSDISYGYIIFYYIECYAPIQLLQNIGTVNIDCLTVSNDIRYHKVQSYFSNNNWKCGVDSNNLFSVTELCEFTFTSGIDYSLMYNEGELILNNFYIHGTGIHFQLIRNKGNTFINNAITKYEYYYDNGASAYDAYTLNIAVYFRNDGNNICGGNLQINNSKIYGAQFQSIYLIGGTNYIQNTRIEQSRLAMSASPNVEYLYIDNVQFINVGTFYISWVAIAQSIGYPPALMLSAKQSIIKNSLFSFYDPWGFIMNSPRAWSIFFSSTIDPNNEEYQMILINNTFELTTHSSFASTDQVIIIKMLLSDEMSEYRESLGDDLDLFLSAFDGSELFYTDGLLLFDIYTSVTMIGNTFYGNQLSQNVAFIAVNNTDTDHVNCMSNNIIYGYALNLISGIVTSCYRNKLTDIIHKTNGTCWNGGLGYADTNYIDNTEDQFVATKTNIDHNIPLISIASSQSIFGAEKISFVLNISTMDSTYNAIHLSEGHLLMFDVKLDDNIDISYDSECDIHCLQIINDTNILQIHGSCTGVNNESSYSSSLLSDSLWSKVSHWSASSIQLISSDQYYPGGKLYINYSIFDSFNHIITDYDKEIHIILSSDILNLHIIATIDANGFCSICEQGIYIQTITMNNVGAIYTIYTSINDNELTVNDILFSVIPCPSGFGLSNGAAQQCAICTNGFFSLYPTTNECMDCTQHNFDLDAISCNGYNHVSINYNYWINIDENYTMISGLCPPFKCCQNTNGCGYFDERSALCSDGRDPSSYLCSTCLPGYSELIASVSCGICERNYIERLIYPLLFAGFITFVIVFSTSSKLSQKNTATYDSIVTIRVNQTGAVVPKKKMKLNDFFIVFTIMIFNPIAYYFQAISYIITHSQGLSVSIYLASFVEIFNLSLDTTASESNGFCFLSNMNAQDKILWSLSISFFCMIVLFIFYMFKLCCCCNIKRKPRYLRAFITILLLCFGNILSVIFKILSCTNIGDGLSVHFYFGYQQCYGVSWWSALAFFCLINISFMLFFIKLYKMDEEQRQSDDSYFRTLTRSYHSKSWFYEGFILFRRTILALFTVTSFANQIYADFIIILFLIFCLIINAKLSPFIHQYINYMELFCLSLTMLMVFIKEDGIFSDFITGILIILPIALLFVFVCLYCVVPDQKLQRYLHVPVNSIQTTPPTLTSNAVELTESEFPVTAQTNEENHHVIQEY